MDINDLYQKAAEELSQARLQQSKISQKEFEIRLSSINQRYSISNNHESNNGKKYLLYIESIRLKEIRDVHLRNSITYAIKLASLEILRPVVFSVSYLVISSINSFIESENLIPVIVPLYIQMEISQLLSNMESKPNTNNLLQTEIQKLKQYII